MKDEKFILSKINKVKYEEEIMEKKAFKIPWVYILPIIIPILVLLYLAYMNMTTTSIEVDGIQTRVRYTVEDIIYDNGPSKIDASLRGNILFYLYLNDSLNLKLYKQDLNWYNGPDEYIIKIYDQRGSLLIEDKISDDGISNNSKIKSEPQEKILELNGIDKGIYKLTLVNPVSQDNPYFDSSIVNLEVNTNKIVLSGETIILTPSNLYLSPDKSVDIFFNIWDKNANQSVEIIGTENYTISLNQENMNSGIKLKAGSYEIKILGNIKIKGTNIAFNKDNFFIPFKEV